MEMETMERIAAGRAVAGKPLFTEKRFYVLLAFVTSLFLLWGIAITMGDVLNRHTMLFFKYWGKGVFQGCG